MTGITLPQLIIWIVSALLGGSGIVGLIMIRPRKNIEHKLDEEQLNVKRMKKVDEHEQILSQMMEEQQVLCYCTLAIAKTMLTSENYKNNDSIAAAVDMMEKHLNKKAHII